MSNATWSWSLRALSAVIFFISWFTVIVLSCSLTVFQHPVGTRAEHGILALASLMWEVRKWKALEIISTAPLRAKTASNSSKQKVLWSYNCSLSPEVNRLIFSNWIPDINSPENWLKIISPLHLKWNARVGTGEIPWQVSNAAVPGEAQASPGDWVADCSCIPLKYYRGRMSLQG